MPHPRLKPAATLLAALALLGGAAGATAATIESGSTVLKVNAAFEPRALPKHTFAPVSFDGSAEVRGRAGRIPATLERIVLDFDRDGRLSVAGLPTCDPETLRETGVAAARRLCAGSIVGEGELAARLALPVIGDAVALRSPLTIFNGPRIGGKPTAILHARTVLPVPETYVIVVPISEHKGEFRYEAEIEIPPLAGGLAYLSRIEAHVGRRYTADGQRRSYVSARCSDGILRSHALFVFSGGFEIEGTGLEKFCRAR